MNNYVRLPLKNVPNCRDIGGYATKNGRVTRWNKILRSSHLSDSTDFEIDYLLARGLSSVIDLRNQTELMREPNPMSSIPEVDYNNFSLLDEDVINDYKREFGEEDFLLGHLYLNIIDNHEKVKNVMDQIFTHKDDTVLYHCSEGKDRTGVITMLILGLAGVSKEDIISNYEVSYTYISASRLKKYPNLQSNILESKRENMIMAYDYLIDKYESFENYFYELGYNPTIVDEFIESILD